VIKSNELWFCIEERCVKTACVGLKAIEADLKRRKDLLTGDWDATPDWVHELIALNENEIAVSKRHFPLVLKRYLTWSGNTLMPPLVAEELLQQECFEIRKPRFEEIANVYNGEAAVLEERVMQGEATQEEKLKLLKYKFVRKFSAEGAASAGGVWNTMFVVAEGEKKSREQQFWNIVHEKQRDLGDAWKAEAASRYAEQAKTSLVRQTCVKELCEVLGLAHSCEEKTWTHEEFESVAPKVLALEEKMRKAMGLRASRSKKTESKFLRSSHLIKDTFASWSASIIEKDADKKRTNGKIVRTYRILNRPIVQMMWQSLQ
jgi:hypothetical protein